MALCGIYVDRQPSWREHDLGYVWRCAFGLPLPRSLHARFELVHSLRTWAQNLLYLPGDSSVVHFLGGTLVIIPVGRRIRTKKELPTSLQALSCEQEPTARRLSSRSTFGSSRDLGISELRIAQSKSCSNALGPK